jgi:hypothetical protein
MRTKAEKLEFVKVCVQIEKAGGDVLDYIQNNWPSYSPRGTWINLQKEFLKRGPMQLTDGRPVIKKEVKKEVKESEKKPKSKQEDVTLKLIECGKKGGDPGKLLSGMGYKNLHSALNNTKAWCRKNHPDWYKDLKDVYLKEPEGAPEKPSKADKEPKPVETRAAKASAVKPSPTCCQPARESGVTVPDEIPDYKNSASCLQDDYKPTDADTAPEDLEVIAVRSKVKGYYMKSDIGNGTGQRYVHLIWWDLITHEERSLGLSVNDWLTLTEEIPQALRQLGLEKQNEEEGEPIE